MSCYVDVRPGLLKQLLNKNRSIWDLGMEKKETYQMTKSPTKWSIKINWGGM